MFPGMQLEQPLDPAPLQFDKTTLGGEADVLDIDMPRLDPRMRGHLAQKVRGPAILFRARHRRKVECPAGWKDREGPDQIFGNRSELVRLRRQRPPSDLLLKPEQLHGTGLEQTGGSVVIGFQALGRTAAVIRQIEAAVQMRMPLLPGVADQIEKRRRYGQACQQLFAVDDALDHIQAQVMQRLGRRFQVTGDLLFGEQVITTLIPVALATDGVETEPLALDTLAPVRALLDTNFFHPGRAPQPPELKMLLLLPPQPLRAVAWLPKPPRETVEDTEPEPLPRLLPRVAGV